MIPGKGNGAAQTNYAVPAVVNAYVASHPDQSRILVDDGCLGRGINGIVHACETVGGERHTPHASHCGGGRLVEGVGLAEGEVYRPGPRNVRRAVVNRFLIGGPVVIRSGRRKNQRVYRGIGVAVVDNGNQLNETRDTPLRVAVEGEIPAISVRLRPALQRRVGLPLPHEPGIVVRDNGGAVHGIAEGISDRITSARVG